jgi:hypothetical protein
MSLWLTPAEVAELTGYKQKSKQRLELARQGFRFTVRHDGFPMVDKSQVVTGDLLTRKQKKREPDFTAIGRA